MWEGRWQRKGLNRDGETGREREKWERGSRLLKVHGRRKPFRSFLVSTSERRQTCDYRVWLLVEGATLIGTVEEATTAGTLSTPQGKAGTGIGGQADRNPHHHDIGMEADIS